MNGINSNTGKRLGGIEHLRQSVRDILTTPIGSRVMRREYGSQLFLLLDKPLNRSTIMDIYAATADAIRRWEPRIRLKSVKLVQAGAGSITIDLVGDYLPDGKAIRLDGIQVR